MYQTYQLICTNWLFLYVRSLCAIMNLWLCLNLFHKFYSQGFKRTRNEEKSHLSLVSVSRTRSPGESPGTRRPCSDGDRCCGRPASPPRGSWSAGVPSWRSTSAQLPCHPCTTRDEHLRGRINDVDPSLITTLITIVPYIAGYKRQTWLGCITRSPRAIALHAESIISSRGARGEIQIARVCCWKHGEIYDVSYLARKKEEMRIHRKKCQGTSDLYCWMRSEPERCLRASRRMRTVDEWRRLCEYIKEYTYTACKCSMIWREQSDKRIPNESRVICRSRPHRVPVIFHLVSVHQVGERCRIAKRPGGGYLRFAQLRGSGKAKRRWALTTTTTPRRSKQMALMVSDLEQRIMMVLQMSVARYVSPVNFEKNFFIDLLAV